jgi:hypothetical protein
MPYVNVKITKGAVTKAQKQALVHDITTSLVNHLNWGSGFISFHFLILQGKQLRVSLHRVIRMLVIQRITMPTASSRGAVIWGTGGQCSFSFKIHLTMRRVQQIKPRLKAYK